MWSVYILSHFCRYSYGENCCLKYAAVAG